MHELDALGAPAGAQGQPAHPAEAIDTNPHRHCSPLLLSKNLLMRFSSLPQSAAAALAALAAVLPQVIRQAAEAVVNSRVVVVGAFAARREQASIHQALEMMAQRRSRHVDVGLDLTSGRTGFV